jgi:hypothetical protein
MQGRDDAFLLALASFAHAEQKKMTVTQFEMLLASNAGKSDSSVADKIYEIELTERLSDARLEKDLALLPGESSRAALTAIADISIFEPLPKEDELKDAAPDVAAQTEMLLRMHAYAAHVIPKLPNFFATRQIKRFVVSYHVAQSMAGFSLQFSALHPMDTLTESVVYRKGREEVEAVSTGNGKSEKEKPGLTTKGLFGPLLQTVLHDSANGAVSWSHWEMRGGKRVAVFAYHVPADASHYEILVPYVQHPLLEHPAYHGEIQLDAETGTILRMTMSAELDPDDLCVSTSTMVDYAQVVIGGKEFYCPVKSVAASMMHTQMEGPGNPVGLGWRKGKWGLVGPPVIGVNDIRFFDHHEFRVDVELVPVPVEQK